MFTTQLYKYLSVFLLFAPHSEEPEVFLSKYSQTAILHAAHFWRLVNMIYFDIPEITGSHLSVGLVKTS